MSRHYNLLVVKAVPSMPIRNKLLLCNSDYIVRIDDLVSFDNELFLVIDKIEWPHLTDDMIIFLSKNIGIAGEVEGIFCKLDYTAAKEKENQEEDK